MEPLLHSLVYSGLSIPSQFLHSLCQSLSLFLHVYNFLSPFFSFLQNCSFPAQCRWSNTLHSARSYPDFNFLTPKLAALCITGVTHPSISPWFSTRRGLYTEGSAQKVIVRWENMFCVCRHKIHILSRSIYRRLISTAGHMFVHFHGLTN